MESRKETRRVRQLRGNLDDDELAFGYFMTKRRRYTVSLSTGLQSKTTCPSVCVCVCVCARVCVHIVYSGGGVAVVGCV